jgi:hypothetical protein
VWRYTKPDVLVAAKVRSVRLTHVRKAKARNTLHQRTLKLFVRHGLKLARRADFSTLDPLAAEHALYLDRRVRSVELVDRHGALEDFLGIIDQRFDGDVGSGGALHARIAETLESQFAEIAENQPELLARHCTEAGQIEKAAGLWGRAGQRPLERSATVEAVAQLTRALDQIAALPATSALRSEEIKIQVRLTNALMHLATVQWLQGSPTAVESRPGRIGPISLGAKQTGERSAGNLHAAFDEAGAGNVAWSRCCDTRKRMPATSKPMLLSTR